MTTAGLYARISSDPSGRALGVERQLRDLRKLARSNGWETVEYVDNHASAYKDHAKRPAFDRLLDDAAAGRVGIIAAWHPDRLARHPRALERLIDVCETRDLPVVTVQAGVVDLSTPSGRAMGRTLVAWGAFEVEHKADRQRSKHRELSEKGLWAGGPRPYGYRVVPADGGGTTLTVVQAEAKVVREIVTRLLGGESLRRIARDLQGRGIVSPSGGVTWYASTVRDIARSPRYAALREHSGRVVGKASWPAIVDPEKHAEVTRLLTDPSRRVSTTSVRSRLLSGVARCGVCGKAIVSGATSTRGKPTYRCPSRAHLARGCAQIDEFVSAVIVARLKRPDALTALSPQDGPRLSALLAKADTVRERLTAMAADWGDDDEMTPAEYRATTARLRERLAALEAQAQALTARTSPVLASIKPSQAEAAWEKLSLADRRTVIDVLAVVTINPAGQGARDFDPATVAITWRSS